jgi:hypothetical protein
MYFGMKRDCSGDAQPQLQRQLYLIVSAVVSPIRQESSTEIQSRSGTESLEGELDEYAVREMLAGAPAG